MDDISYHSYLLRMWRVIRDEKFVWMASLDDPHTGNRQSFTSLEDLYVFLLQQADEIVQEQRFQAKTQTGQDFLLIIRTNKELKIIL
jgi:hypothetical protein